MVNHARNLLLNTRRSQLVGLPGVEYVPPEFVPRQLNGAANLIYKTLFGAQPDGLKLNYRTQELLRLVHATELAEFLYWRDARVTYLPFNDRLFELAVGGTVQALTGDTELLVGGEAPAEYRGALYSRWRVTATAADMLEIQQTYPVSAATIAELVFETALSNPVPLPNTRMTLSTYEPTAGDKWLITATARPVDDLASITYKLSQLPAETLLWVFGLDAAEPWQTFRNLWEQTQTPYKLAGFLCAYIWRLDLLPQKGN